MRNTYIWINTQQIIIGHAHASDHNHGIIFGTKTDGGGGFMPNFSKSSVKGNFLYFTYSMTHTMRIL